MPIRINFLAEQLTQEDLRRRDPVKRGVLGGVVLVALALASVLVLRLKHWQVGSEAQIFVNKYKGLENRYNLAKTNELHYSNGTNRLAALYKLASARRLWGSALDALQHSARSEVELTGFHVVQTYALIEGTKPSTNKATGVVTPGKPPKSRERVTLSLDARDYGDAASRPGDLIDGFKEAVNGQPFFKTNLSGIRMGGRSPVQVDATSGRPFVAFKLECDFVEKER